MNSTPKTEQAKSCHSHVRTADNLKQRTGKYLKTMG